MTLHSGPAELKRFQLGNMLGEGADLQVFAARDSQTGDPVVVKRPHPALVSRNIHRDVERRTLLHAEMRMRNGDLPGLVRLHVLTAPDSFAWYFDDNPGRPYSVQVEERARGIPLVGGVSDIVRGHPVGLPLNLFVLHLAVAHIGSDYTNPALTALAIVERFYEEGYLVQDLGPQNVFYSPGSGASKIIDLGTLRGPSQATSRRPPFDLNDVLFEIFESYTTPESPPRDPARFAQIRETRLSGTLERKAEALAKEYATAPNPEQADAAQRILFRIAGRDYISPAGFRADFEAYLMAAKSVERDRAAGEAWIQALQELRSPYWKKYLFDAENELSQPRRDSPPIP